MIDLLEIEQKRKPFPFAPASTDDFASHFLAEVDPSLLIADPTISLYCLDHEARRALFVQVPRDVDITAAPFLYMAQYDHATRLLAVPYDVLHQVAAAVTLAAPLVFLYSTGRAGSTLLSKAFAAMGSVTSLSEPDVYTQAVALGTGGEQDDELRRLLGDATRILFNPAFTRGSTLHVVKFRSQGIELCDLLHDLFPQAKNLFLYRDLVHYINSAMRAFEIDERSPDVQRDITAKLATIVPLLAEELSHRANLHGSETTCFVWLSAMRSYARLRAEGVPILPVRYEKMVSNPSDELETILAYLDLPGGRVPDALRAFERDSQAGSPLSREESSHRVVVMDEQEWELIRQLVQRYPITGADIPRESITIP